MRILSVGNFLNPSWDGSIPDEEHIAQALEELGHEVIRQQRESEWNEPIPDVDFVLIAQWGGYPDFLSNFKDAGIPTVYWAFDHQDQSQEWHQRLVQGADLYLSKRIADSIYPNWQWLAQDFAPQFLDKAPEVNKDIDVLFTGSYLPWATERIETLKAVDERFNLTIHSVTPNEWKAQGFKNVHGPVMDDALPALIARAKVNLSIDHTIEAGYWSDRPAQIMCCGGFVLHRYQPLCETRFGAWINYFYGVDSCLKGIEHWLDADEDREIVAATAYEFAQENLKVRNRVNNLITIVENHLENRTV